MTQTEAKKIFLNIAQDKLLEWGFKHEKTRNSVSIFFKEKEDRKEELVISTLNYIPSVVFPTPISYIYIYSVEDILKQINEKFSLNLGFRKVEHTLYYRENKLLTDLKLGEIENSENKQGVVDSTAIIMDYIENQIMPFFQKVEDIREINNSINGEGEDFWENDFNAQLPFSLGQFFFERRIIIAWLCNHPDFDGLVDKVIATREKNIRLKSNKDFVFDRKDLKNSFNATVKYLNDNVKPFY